MSSGYWWAIGGLSTDIVGGSLLAVEAIKLDNVRKLAHILQTKIREPLTSPIFRPDDDSPPLDIPEDELEAMGFHHHTSLYVAAHFIGGWLLIGLIELIVFEASGFDMVGWLNDEILDLPIWATVLVYIVALWVALFVLGYLLGEFVIHTLISGSVGLALKLFTFVDEKTPTGTTGIIGFLFLFAGFLGQIAGVVLNG